MPIQPAFFMPSRIAKNLDFVLFDRRVAGVSHPRKSRRNSSRAVYARTATETQRRPARIARRQSDSTLARALATVVHSDWSEVFRKPAGSRNPTGGTPSAPAGQQRFCC